MLQPDAQVVKLVDTLDLGSSASRCGSSSLLLGNISKLMKPKDLPFTIKSFSTRGPSYIDGVLTIPYYFEAVKKALLPVLNQRINSAQRIHVEICSGNGEWIVDKAAKNPEILYVAVEKKFMRVRKIWSKMKNAGLENLLIVSGMGEDFFTYYLTDNSVEEIFINFPDPWPKARHAKHRIIKDSFLPPIHKILKQDGKITVTTDSVEYSTEILDVFGKSSDFENFYPEKGYAILDEEYGGSYFRRLWADLGRENRLMTFKRQGPACALQKT